MSNFRFRMPGSLSLKTRFSLAVGILIVFTALVLTLASVFIVQRGIEDVIGEREVSLVNQVARDIDQRIMLRQGALVKLATELGKAGAHTPDQYQERLAFYHSLAGFFGNLSVLNAQGEHIANMENPLSRGQMNFSSREYFSETMRSDAPVISRPLRSQISGRPVVIMTAPIHDAEGRITDMLLATIDLGHDSFIKDMSVDRIGKNGYLYILSSEGVFLTHPDETRVLKHVDEIVKRGPSVERALGGFEGSVRDTTEQGVDALMSYKRLATTGWVLASVYPIEHAFAFGGQVRWNAAIIAFLLLLVIAPVAWLVIDRQLLPLTELGERMKAGRAAPATALVHKDDEIGDLGRAFDHLMAERDSAESAMIDSENKLRVVTDSVPALVAYVDRHERFVFGNNRYKDYYGVSSAELPGMSVRQVVGADIYLLSKQYVDAALSGRSVCFERHVRRHGEQQWDRVSYTPDIDAQGMVNGYFVLVDDITELKTAQIVLAKSEKRIRTIADNMPALIGYIDTELRYRFCNSTYGAVTGLTPEQIIGRTVSDVFGAEAFAAVASQMADALCGKHVSFEHKGSANREGKLVHMSTDYIPDICADGKVVGFYTMVMDISKRKEAEGALATQERLLHTVTNNLPALVNFIDAKGYFGFVNRHHESWFGRPLDQITGKQVTSVLSPAEAEVHTVGFDKAMAGQTVKFEFARQHNGDLRHYHATYIPQIEADGVVSGVTGLVNDVTDAKLVEQQLKTMTRFDALTGLPNRIQLGERIARAQLRSARSGLSMAVMYLDLDKFKTINDSFGHSGGDAVLIEFGKRLSASVRQSDTVGRLAGDEFVILLEGLHDASECAIVARKVIKAMEKPFDIDGVARIVSTSIGVATAANGTASAETLLKQADDALYRAKETGRNRYAMTAIK